MRTVYSSPDAVKVRIAHELLGANGIVSIVGNEALAGDEAQVTLSVRDADAEAAGRLLEHFGEEPPAPPSPLYWACPKCGELLEEQFRECWRCAPSKADAASSSRHDARDLRRLLWLRRSLLGLVFCAFALILFEGSREIGLAFLLMILLNGAVLRKLSERLKKRS